MKKLLNDGWSFLKLHLNSTIEEAHASAEWRQVDLPHDWLIWQCDDLYESADAWYRREIVFDTVPPQCYLHFDGVYMDCDILVNNEIVGNHAYGYTAFYIDLSEKIRSGKNEVLVHIRHQSPNSRWYSGSGIYRDVHLIQLPADHIVPDSFYLAEYEYGTFWNLNVTAETAGKDHVMFSCAAYNPEGKKIGSAVTESKNGNVSVSVRLSGAAIWDTDHPFLNTLQYTYGQETGEIRFGLRTAEFTPDHGFYLNHRPIKLKGVCLHHDLGSLGSAFHRKAAQRQLQLMKDMGANAVRTAHNPPASEFLDLCDEMGILVIDEAFDMWERPKTTYDYARFFKEYEESDVASWIRRDRCHPSVILWSVGNEIYDMHADCRGTEVCTMLMEQVHGHDPKEHAKVTFGCNYMPWEGGQRCADIVKIAGYNYGEKYYDEHHRKHPDWVIYGSETASVLSSRGIYHFPAEKSIMSESDLQCSALGNSNTSWGALDLKEMIVRDLKCSFSLGQFIWSGIDYIGEPTPYHTRSCYFGQADTACFPKDSYYLFQSLWSEKRVLHIGVSWDWNPGQMIDIPVMTNYSRVELLLNGRTLGIRDVLPDDAEKCLPVWKVPYEPGILTARAIDKAGNILRETKKETPGNTSRFRLESENAFLAGDSHDLIFVTVQAEDDRGIPVENARDYLNVNVSGGGYLIGTDNGDSTDHDGYKQSSRRLFNGKLLLIIASNGISEDVVIQVHSTSGIESGLRIPVKKSKKIDGISCIQRITQNENTDEIPVRKIEIIACGNRNISPENAFCTFKWKKYPENGQLRFLTWQITNDAGVECPFSELHTEGENIRAGVRGDGKYYLRGLGGSAPDHPEIISQIEFIAAGMGKPAINPYDFVCAGLYDLHEGNIGAGNEKGIAFARDERSMVGYSRIDFGKAGSSRLTLSIFALDDREYEIEFLDGNPGNESGEITLLKYKKPSIWNTYQDETYDLPYRLAGVHTLCFRLKDKVHLKGFRFEKQSRAFQPHYSGEADFVSGDSYCMEEGRVNRIGNNVSLRFDEMDFGNMHECILMISGKTELKVNPITIHCKNERGETTDGVADFRGNTDKTQFFRMSVPGGICTITFIFLPGSNFDFDEFCFRAGPLPDSLTD